MQLRVDLSARRRAVVKRLFPQLAKNLEVTDLGAFINDDTWVMEQKLDGHRLFISSPEADGPPIITNRSGASYTKKIPTNITEYRFPSGRYILDGELMHESGGRSVFWVFDIIVGTDDGGWTTHWTTEQRRIALEHFMVMAPGPFRLVPRAKTRDEKIALAHRALREGYEGLILKRLGKPYRSAGRTEEWLKLKFIATVDVVVTDVRGDGKESVGYAVYEGGGPQGGPVLKSIGRASLIGKEKKDVIAVGDVIEVRYLYVGADGRLYQPTILRKRFDKLAHECTGDQLRYVNKAVLETL